MSYFKKLIGEKCYLSPLTDDDAENWVRWHNDIDISMPESNVYVSITLQNMRNRVNRHQSNMESVFTVVDLETDSPIGTVEITYSTLYRTGSLGVIIGEKQYWGRGFGREAINLILDYGFNLLNLHNIMLGVYAFNTRAIGLYGSMGFREIGRKREYQTMGGRKIDMIMMDMLSHEYESVYIKKVLGEMEA